MRSIRATLVTAALLIAIATGLGAFGTHVLKPTLPPARFESFETGVLYQFFHSLGLFGLGILRREPGRDSAWLRGAGLLLLLGMALFCGSIYGLTFGAPRVLGMVAPFGGLSLMAGWVLAALAIARDR